MKIRSARASDIEAVNEIYNDEVATSTSTFDTEPRVGDRGREWFESHQSDSYPLLVAEDGAEVLGWASLATAAPRHVLVEKKTESGVIIGYRDTPFLPGTGDKYRVHDPDRPVPKYVDPGPPKPAEQPGSIPADAIVLFDGDDLDAWEPSSWKVTGGYVEAGEGSLVTKEAFGDLKLHLEWMVPTTPPKHMMSRGNSGVLLMGLYEIQIFDSHPDHDVHIYPDGQARSVHNGCVNSSL